ncbi:aspartic and glutamic acid-rich protein-like, partial [Pecten maximus]|uniref:aspartic and glutamic acid-rich protein-like n=1 Tax=Pecten maximus TaxID=6579 RepID=UPI0014589368
MAEEAERDNVELVDDSSLSDDSRIPPTTDMQQHPEMNVIAEDVVIGDQIFVNKSCRPSQDKKPDVKKKKKKNTVKTKEEKLSDVGVISDVYKKDVDNKIVGDNETLRVDNVILPNSDVESMAEEAERDNVELVDDFSLSDDSRIPPTTDMQQHPEMNVIAEDVVIGDQIFVDKSCRPSQDKKPDVKKKKKKNTVKTKEEKLSDVGVKSEVYKKDVDNKIVGDNETSRDDNMILPNSDVESMAEEAERDNVELVDDSSLSDDSRIPPTTDMHQHPEMNVIAEDVVIGDQIFVDKSSRPSQDKKPDVKKKKKKNTEKTKEEKLS